MEPNPHLIKKAQARWELLLKDIGRIELDIPVQFDAVPIVYNDTMRKHGIKDALTWNKIIDHARWALRYHLERLDKESLTGISLTHED